MRVLSDLQLCANFADNRCNASVGIRKFRIANQSTEDSFLQPHLQPVRAEDNVSPLATGSHSALRDVLACDRCIDIRVLSGGRAVFSSENIQSLRCSDLIRRNSLQRFELVRRSFYVRIKTECHRHPRRVDPFIFQIAARLGVIDYHRTIVIFQLQLRRDAGKVRSFRNVRNVRIIGSQPAELRTIQSFDSIRDGFLIGRISSDRDYSIPVVAVIFYLRDAGIPGFLRHSRIYRKRLVVVNAEAEPRARCCMLHLILAARADAGRSERPGIQ